MKTSSLLAFIIAIVGILFVVYSLLQLQPTQAEVNAEVTTLTPANENKAINTNILNLPIISTIENYKIFGEHPINPGNVSRNNPFGGI